MIDPAYEETERLVKEMEKKISKEYKKAEAEIRKKLDKYMKSFTKKDQKWAEWVADKKVTKKAYMDWRVGQMAMKERWESMRDALAKDYHNANAIARRIVHSYMPEVYAINYNYGAYEIEHGLGVDTSFTMYNRHAVEMLLKDNPNLFRPPGTQLAKSETSKAIGREIMWNKNKLQSAMMQSILQGEPIPKIADRVSEIVTTMNKNAAIRTARTMTTGAQNAGRFDSYTRARNMGIELEKQWMATLDSRTRHSHRKLDGEHVPLDEEFSNGLMYPGDPDGDPSELYNCRCVQLAYLIGFENDLSDLSLREDSGLEDMSYDEWKESKKVTSNAIDLPKKKSNAIRGAWNKKYREF